MWRAAGDRRRDRPGCERVAHADADADPHADADSVESETEIPEPAPTTDALVYYLVDTRVGPRLVRESRPVTGAPGVAEVEAMIAGAQDPDYRTTWNPGTQVLSVQRRPTAR